MALEMARQRTSQEVTIFSDSQAALQAIEGSQTSGQQIISMIITDIEELRKLGTRVRIHWIPAHQGIQGNELAEKAAKEATGWRLEQNSRGRNIQVDTNTTAPRLDSSKQPLFALKGTLKTQIHKQWEESWQQDTRGRVH